MGKRNRAAAIAYCERRERLAHCMLLGWTVGCWIKWAMGRVLWLWVVWGWILAQKRFVYTPILLPKQLGIFWSYSFSFCPLLMQASMDVSPFNKGRESTIWGVSLMLGYLGYDFSLLLHSMQQKTFKVMMQLMKSCNNSGFCIFILFLRLIQHGNLLLLSIIILH